MYSATDQAYLFKETWSDISKNCYNSATALLARVKKKYDLQGTKDHVAIPQGPAGGIGGLTNGYLPEGGGDSGGVIEITAKDVVGVAVVDRKAMKQAMTDKGSFVRFTQQPVQKCVESYDTAVNILWHGDGTGRFGTLAAANAYVSGGATAPVLEFTSGSFHERWFPKNFQFNISNSGDTGVEDCLLKVTSVDATNRRVTFSRVSGTFDCSTGVNDRYIYLQNMFKNAPQGLEGTVMATTGNIYTLAYDATSWGSFQYDANGAPPSVSLMNYVYSQQSVRVDAGNYPNFILTSPEIWAILADIWEPSKRMTLMPRDKSLSAPSFGIAALSYTTLESKDIPIVADKHCKKNRMYFLFDEVMYMHHLPDQGWWDEDGKVFLRVPGRPWYSATYGGYFENVLNPTFMAVLYNIGIT